MSTTQQIMTEDQARAYVLLGNIAEGKDGPIDVTTLIREGHITLTDIKTYIDNGGTGIPEITDPHIAFLGLAADPNELPEFITEGATIQKLMDFGVTAEDFQVINDKTLNCEAGKGLMFSIQGGDAMTRLAAAAREVTGTPQGKCHTGVKQIYRRAGLGSWIENAGGSAYMLHKTLEETGKVVCIYYENRAYQNCLMKNSEDMQKLYFNHFPEGVTLVMYNIKDPKVKEEVIKKGGKNKKGKDKFRPGATHGHDAVMTGRQPGQAACDGVQNIIYVRHYGKEFYAIYPKDAYVPQEYAELLLERVLERQLGGITLTQEQADELLTIAAQRKAAENIQIDQQEGLTPAQQPNPVQIAMRRQREERS